MRVAFELVFEEDGSGSVEMVQLFRAQIALEDLS